MLRRAERATLPGGARRSATRRRWIPALTGTCHLFENCSGLEARTMRCRQTIKTCNRLCGTHRIEFAQPPTAKCGETNTEECADITIARRPHNAFAHRARGFVEH